MYIFKENEHYFNILKQAYPSSLSSNDCFMKEATVLIHEGVLGFIFFQMY